MGKRGDLSIDVAVPNVNYVNRKLKNVSGGADKALMRTINYAIGKTQTKITKAVTKRYKVKYSSYKSVQKVHKANKGSLYGEIKVINSKVSAHPNYSGSAINQSFKASPSIPKPIKPPNFYKSQILKTGGMKKIDSCNGFSKAFVADLPNRGIDFYRRVTGQKVFDKKTKTMRDALIAYRPTSISSMLEKSIEKNEVENFIRKTMKERLDHEINYLMRGK